MIKYGKTNKPFHFIILIFLSVLGNHCGTFVGNPAGPEDTDDEKTANPDGTAGTDGEGNCETSILPDVSPVSSQLVFQLTGNIDQCSAQGYVVGYSDRLKVERAEDGLYFINNIPAGDHDIIITASEKGAGLLDGATTRGRRLNDINFLSGVKTDSGEIELPHVGAITGKVTLSDQTDHAGIHVYIPGTGFDATTDSNGSYTISPFVPVGINNLYFEKDGYHRGQIENVEVIEATTSTVTDITLVISNGAEGFIVIENGADLVAHLTVEIVIGATENAVLMKIAETDAFLEVPWQPIVTSTHYTFDTDGSKTLYVKFADANGLESSPFLDKITTDVTPPSFSPSILYTEGDTLVVSVPDDSAAFHKIAFEADFDDAAWEPYTGSKTLPFSRGIVKAQLKDQAGNLSKIKSVTVSYVPKLDTSGYGVRAVSLGDKVYFANSESNKVDIFDMSTGMKTTASLFERRTRVTTGRVGNKLFFAGGGSDNLSYSNIIDVYDADTDAWSTATLSVARRLLAAATVGTKIIFAGGRSSNSSPISTNAVDIYDNSSDTWTTATLSEARFYLSAATVGNKALFAGGTGESGHYATVDIYNNDTNSWSTSSLSVGKSFMGATTIGNKAYFIGGCESGSTGGWSTIIDVYDGSTNSWSVINLPAERSTGTAGNAGSLLFFANQDAIEIYDSVADEWLETVTPLHSGGYPGIASTPDYVLIGGGQNHNRVMIYDLNEGTWTDTIQ